MPRNVREISDAILRQCFDSSSVAKMGSSSLAVHIAPGQGNVLKDHWDYLMRMTVIPIIILDALRIPEAQEEEKAGKTGTLDGEAKIWNAISDLKDMQVQVLSIMQKQQESQEWTQYRKLETENSNLGGAVSAGTTLTHMIHMTLIFLVTTRKQH